MEDSCFSGRGGREGWDSRDKKVKLVKAMANTLFQSLKWSPQREHEIPIFFSSSLIFFIVIFYKLNYLLLQDYLRAIFYFFLMFFMLISYSYSCHYYQLSDTGALDLIQTSSSWVQPHGYTGWVSIHALPLFIQEVTGADPSRAAVTLQSGRSFTESQFWCPPVCVCLFVCLCLCL